MNTADILKLLEEGTFEVEGVLPWSSNYAFLVTICLDAVEVVAVYKPKRGERPLWDFPTGTLYLREYTAFLVSQQLGWQLVPPTILREGPHGIGSVQLFVEHDPELHYFTFEGDPAFRDQLQQMVLFDIIINNADRKGGHVLLETPSDESQLERIWGIDHGICFHDEPKLRTVIWEFSGTPIPNNLLDDLRQLQQRLASPDDGFTKLMNAMLAFREVQAVQNRITKLLMHKNFPQPGPGRHYPWPPV
ncbi:MAG: SCO1664 family protein [Chloroflexota bacterium]